MITFGRYCPGCNELTLRKLPVHQSQHYDWMAGTLIQHAMPQLSDDEREFIVSGTCPGCWDNLMGEEDAEA